MIIIMLPSLFKTKENAQNNLRLYEQNPRLGQMNWTRRKIRVQEDKREFCVCQKRQKGMVIRLRVDLAGQALNAVWRGSLH